MKYEDRELLVKDICARLPYGVKAKEHDDEPPFKIVAYDGSEFFDDDGWGHKVENIKLYLYPMESLNDKKKMDEYKKTLALVGVNWHFTNHSLDWLYKNHIDIYSFIDMGIAVDATGLGIYME